MIRAVAEPTQAAQASDTDPAEAQAKCANGRGRR